MLAARALSNRFRKEQVAIFRAASRAVARQGRAQMSANGSVRPVATRPAMTGVLSVPAISSRAAVRLRDYLGGGQSLSVGKTNGMTILGSPTGFASGSSGSAV